MAEKPSTQNLAMKALGLKPGGYSRFSCYWRTLIDGAEKAIIEAEARGFKAGLTVGITAAEYKPIKPSVELAVLDAALQAEAQKVRMREALENLVNALDTDVYAKAALFPDYQEVYLKAREALQDPLIDLGTLGRTGQP